MWSRLGFRKLSGNQKTWAMGGVVLSFGAVVKVSLFFITPHFKHGSIFLNISQFGYFYLSREMVMENLQSRDKDARKYLKESQDWGNWAAEDRKKRAPPLTKEQREQLQNYLAMMANENKDVYPTKYRKST